MESHNHYSPHEVSTRKTKEELFEELLNRYGCRYHQYPSIDNPHGCIDCFNTGYIIDNPEMQLLIEFERENGELKEQIKRMRFWKNCTYEVDSDGCNKAGDLDGACPCDKWELMK